MVLMTKGIRRSGRATMGQAGATAPPPIFLIFFKLYIFRIFKLYIFKFFKL